MLALAPRAEGDFTATAPRSTATGATFSIHLTGVAPGERVCVSQGNVTYEFPGRPRTTQVTFGVDQPGTRTFRVWVGSEHRDVTVRFTS